MGHERRLVHGSSCDREVACGLNQSRDSVESVLYWVRLLNRHSAKALLPLERTVIKCIKSKTSLFEYSIELME